MNDRYRPAEYQINDIWECSRCRQRIEMASAYSAGACGCGGEFVHVGESYPADVSEWDEERGQDGEWHYRY